MALRREDCVIAPGWRLVKESLGYRTRRDPECPRSWMGLTACDRSILSAWVAMLGDELEELHTDVPVGFVPGEDLCGIPEHYRDAICSAHALRIDACVLRSGGWWVVELKGDAGYKALGQVLCYGFWAARCCGVLSEPSLVVVTDRVQEALRPVFAAYGVRVEEVGSVLLEGSEDSMGEGFEG